MAEEVDQTEIEAASSQDIVAQDCHLLALPRELRNEIWQLALPDVNPDCSITHPYPVTPPLLRVCRQARGEAIAYWLQQNSFVIRIQDCDGRFYSETTRLVLGQLIMSAAKYGVMTEEKAKAHRIRRWMIMAGSRSWTNLIEWMRVLHSQSNPQGRWPLPSQTGSTSPVLKVVIAAMSIAISLQGLPWIEVETVLRRYRDAVEALDGRWT